MLRSALPLLVIGPFVWAAASAQIANPADTQREAQKSSSAEAGPSRPTAADVEGIVVEGRQPNFHEEELIGSYGQPRWTAFRRFPTTRVYVRPQGYAGVEQWFRFEDPRDGKTEVQGQTELEFGLPHRVQLDLYLVTRHAGGQERSKVDNSIEVRYAFADWGKLWGNPTLYLEWVNQDTDPNKVEAKLLLGGELRAGWHWGTDFSWEYEAGGQKTREYENTFGLSRTLKDDKLSMGLETKVSYADVTGSRGDWEKDIRVGPSIQWRPVPRMHFDFSPLVGLTHESHRFDVYMVFGYEF
jgi:hypothetical protein